MDAELSPLSFRHLKPTETLLQDGISHAPARRRPAARWLLALVLSATAPALLADDLERQIAAVRAEVKAVHDEAASYRTTEVEVEDLSLEGGEAVCFWSGAELRKVNAKLYGETYHAALELFYADDALVFVLQRTRRYDTQVGLDVPAKVESVDEHRLYFSGGKMIRCLHGARELEPGSDAFADLESSTTTAAQGLRQACSGLAPSSS